MTPRKRVKEEEVVLEEPEEDLPELVAPDLREPVARTLKRAAPEPPEEQ